MAANGRCNANTQVGQKGIMADSGAERQARYRNNHSYVPIPKMDLKVFKQHLSGKPKKSIGQEIIKAAQANVGQYNKILAERKALETERTKLETERKRNNALDRLSQSERTGMEKAFALARIQWQKRHDEDLEEIHSLRGMVERLEEKVIRMERLLAQKS